jgi:phage terminase small subunit
MKKTKRGRPLNMSGVFSSKHHYTKAEKLEFSHRAETLQKMAEGSALLPPSWISKTSKEIFDDVISDYKKLHAEILCDLDMNELTMYCDSLANYLFHKENLPKFRQKMNELIDQADGVADKAKEDEDYKSYRDLLGSIRSLSYSIKNEEDEMYRQESLFMQHANQLGLTPEGRARLADRKKIQEEEDKDPGAAWANKISIKSSKDIKA